MSATIHIKGLEGLQKKIKTIEQMNGVKAAIQAASLHVKGKIAKYPPRKKVTIQQAGGWASDKQRRYFFWALREGKIEVPYRRGQSPGSKDLGQKWTISTRDNGMTGIVGNNVSYGPYVQSGKQQSSMMGLIGWKTTDTVVQEESDEVMDILGKAIRKVLNA